MRRPGRPAAAGGQATVELALCLPFVVLVLLLVVQVGLVVRADLLVTHAAREAARAAAVGAPPPAPDGLDPAATTVDVRSDPAAAGGWVTARVTTRLATDLPLVGPLVPDVTLREEVTMRREAVPP